jgi:hypothetical protein
MFHLLTANKRGLNHNQTLFKPKKKPKTWFKPEKPGINQKNAKNLV